MARTNDPHAATLKAWLTRKRGIDRPVESEGLGTWTADGVWVPDNSEAMQSWGKGKGVVPGDVPIPFPVWTEAERNFDLILGKDWWQGNRPVNKAEPVARAKRVEGSPMMVPVGDLIATQHVVTGSQVEKLTARLKAGGKARSVPIIVRVGGKHFIYDGHHRATVAKVTGESQIMAEVFELPTPAHLLTRVHF